MTVAQKGLTLVILLIFVELVFGYALHVQLKRAAKEAELEGHVKDIHLHMQSVTRGLYSAHEKLDAWFKSWSDADEKNLHEIFSKFQSEMEYLKQHVDKDPEQLRQINELQSEASSLFSRNDYWLAKIKEYPPGDRPTIIGQSIVSMRDQKRKVLQLAVNFLKFEQEQLNSLPPSQDLIRQNMQMIVWIALSFNILLALLLALLFSRDVSKRLQVILENTRRLASSEDLIAPLKGNDEIAMLDHSFHEMARQMREYELLRRSYVAMFREELSSPLEQVHLRFKLLLQKEKGAVSDKGRELLRSGERNLIRLIGIVDDLTETNTLSPSTSIKIHPTQVNLREILERSVDSVKEFALKKGVKLEISSESDCTFIADGDRLIQVLINFLSNAAKFSPKGETVKIEAGMADGDVRIAVIDKGRGVPKEQAIQIFEKFQQVQNSDGKRGSGTGLGLNICKRIIELHGGRIGCDSQEGIGSSFWIQVPVKPKESER